MWELYESPIEIVLNFWLC